MVGPSAHKYAPHKQFGAYEILAPLAIGGTAELFLARRSGEAGFEKIVVLKQLLEHLADDGEFVDMFLDEARIGSHLDHSNVVRTLELGSASGRYFIAMEFISGLTVAQTVVKAQHRVPGGLPIGYAVHIIEQACAGLHHAHEAELPDGTPLRIVHRDVSPQNLVITYTGEVKVVDFGIAYASVRATKTKAGRIKGKFAYMSPEQCLGKPVDRRTDVFALGVVLFECITGKRLFKRKSTYETYQAIVKGKIVPPSLINPGVHPGLDEIALRALAHNPDDRFATAEDLRDALEGWRESLGIKASARELQRFYAKYFREELNEHREWMAQIRAGRTPQGDLYATGSWKAFETPDKSGPIPVLLSADPAPSPLGEPIPVAPPSAGAVVADDVQRIAGLASSFAVAPPVLPESSRIPVPPATGHGVARESTVIGAKVPISPFAPVLPRASGAHGKVVAMAPATPAEPTLVVAGAPAPPASEAPPDDAVISYEVTADTGVSEPEAAEGLVAAARRILSGVLSGILSDRIRLIAAVVILAAIVAVVLALLFRHH